MAFNWASVFMVGAGLWPILSAGGNAAGLCCRGKLLLVAAGEAAIC